MTWRSDPLVRERDCYTELLTTLTYPDGQRIDWTDQQWRVVNDIIYIATTSKERSPGLPLKQVFLNSRGLGNVLAGVKDATLEDYEQVFWDYMRDEFEQISRDVIVNRYYFVLDCRINARGRKEWYAVLDDHPSDPHLEFKISRRRQGWLVPGWQEWSKKHPHITMSKGKWGKK